MTTDLFTRAGEIFQQVMGVPLPHGPATVPDDVDGWDSLNQVRLAHALEQEFGRMLPEELLLLPGTFGDLLDALGSAP